MLNLLVMQPVISKTYFAVIEQGSSRKKIILNFTKRAFIWLTRTDILY